MALYLKSLSIDMSKLDSYNHLLHFLSYHILCHNSTNPASIIYTTLWVVFGALGMVYYNHHKHIIITNRRRCADSEQPLRTAKRFYEDGQRVAVRIESKISIRAANTKPQIRSAELKFAARTKDSSARLYGHLVSAHAPSVCDRSIGRWFDACFRQ